MIIYYIPNRKNEVANLYQGVRKLARRSRKTKAKTKKGVTETFAPPLNFTSKNYMFFGIGLLLIIIGYLTLPLSRDGWISLYVAPISLVAGYCVFIPLAILYRKKETMGG